MLIVLAEATLGDGALEEARTAFTAIIDATRKEEGCIAYSFAVDVLDPKKLLIVEKWVDDAALSDHFATSHMATFQAALAGLDVTITELAKYQSDDGSPIG